MPALRPGIESKKPAQTFWVVLDDGRLLNGLSEARYLELSDAGRTLDGGEEA